ncbi:MAG: AAA family ATPase [Acidobacteriota bacterium]|nr:AAA family ATPase [Acidobacteriota bacterium]
MHITKIELEDIKSHTASKYEFQRGTTAITGANGAGKTTLIEAVAWTLFDLLDYKRDDFARRGAKKGVVKVTFESGLDEREYLVYRDTGTGYYVYDTQLKTRIAEKKEEVKRFLWQHLGVEAGTDLEALFRRAIGVPQGTFTAIFLESPTERKKAFDKLLKVEEYRQGAEKLRETARYIDLQIIAVREKIARAEGELSRFEDIEAEHKNFRAQTEELSETSEKLNKTVAEKGEIVKRFDESETKVNELKTLRDKLQSETSQAEFVERQKESERNQALNAQEKTKRVEAGYKTHIAALSRLKELERERIEREKLNAEMARVEKAQVNVKADKKKFQEDLEKSLKAHQEIAALEPKILEQERLEKERETLRNQVADAKAVENQIASLTEKMNRLRESYRTNQISIKDAETKSAEAKFFEERRRRDNELTNNLARLRAKLESDEKFQSEIQNGLCPILSQKCLNLQAGQTLESFVNSQFGEIKISIAAFEMEQIQLVDKLKTAREAEKFSATLETLRSREKEISEEGTRYKEERKSLEEKIENLPKTKSDLAEIENKLKTLDNPKAKIKLLQTEASREINIKEQIASVEKNLERLESDRHILVEQLESYQFLDAQWTQFSESREKTETAHREFLSNESLAQTLPEREKEFLAATREAVQLKSELGKAEKDFLAASKDYDRDAHLSEKALLLEAERRLAETRANLENTKNRADELDRELQRLAEIRKEMQGEFQEKERLEKIGEATKFIRDTLKEAAPRVARNYVYHVSMEANQMFREISGNAERTLKWTEDYGISLEENGYERPFINLSGGEQMAAALSVRLALLKQLSDVRLAFFDEPTTNMDAERRERLAEQISHITERKTFDQLFVISHDDTFEGYVDNVISVGGNGNE